MEQKFTSENKVQSALKAQARKLQARWRKAVTGSPSKRVRDHLREAQGRPQNVKLLDKISFTLGVLNIVACQYFLMSVPEYFGVWYTVVIPLMMISRYWHFKKQNYQYFLIDFCYLTILSSLINLTLLRGSELFFKICFIFSTGVLPIAIPVWRNSLIFHDFDKIVSVYIHILPCMLYYALRWHGLEGVAGSCLGSSSPCHPLGWSDYGYALMFYCVWQAAYLVKTEILEKENFDAHPEILTSLRWLAKDTKNDASRSVLRGLRKIGLFGRSEEFDSTSMKTKLVFVASQLALTVFSFLPTWIVYNSSSAHLCWIGFIFTVSIFNGASFYIEVFSVRYQVQLKRLDEMQSIARDATAAMQQLAGLSQKDSKDQYKTESNESLNEKISPPESSVGTIVHDGESEGKENQKTDFEENDQKGKSEDSSPHSRDSNGDDVELSEDEGIKDMLETVAMYENDFRFLDDPE